MGVQIFGASNPWNRSQGSLKADPYPLEILEQTIPEPYQSAALQPIHFTPGWIGLRYRFRGTPGRGLQRQQGKAEMSSAVTSFTIVMIKPSHYDDDGYPITWYRSIIPS